MVIGILLHLPCTSSAQELRALGGALRGLDPDSTTFTYQIEYKEALTENFGYSFTYLNEGHIPANHRDGHGAQLWAATHQLDRRLSLGVGLGPYFSCNTTPAEQGQQNEHAWQALVSLAATWYTDSRWIYELRTNYVGLGDGMDTLAVLFGVGYQLEPPPSPGPLTERPRQYKYTTGNELTLFVGGTGVHNGGGDSSRHSVAAGIEYRRGVWKNVDWTATFLHEGENGLTDRTGLMTQLWAVRAFMDDRLALGIGAGPYFAIDVLREPEAGKDDEVNAYAAVTMTASYRFDPSWGIRFYWHRIISDHDKDSDVLTIGPAYLF